MQSNGDLICTSPTTKIRRTENLVDTFHIIVPQQFKDVNLIEFQASIKYVDPANTPRVEILDVKNPAYKDVYIEYTLPITTLITKLPGEVKMHMTFTMINEEEKQVKVGHSSEITIKIDDIPDYFTDETSFSAIDRRILELQRLAQQYAKEKADNLAKEGSELYLTSNGERIGDSILLPEGTEDDFTVVQF